MHMEDPYTGRGVFGLPADPVPRLVVARRSERKWQGCVYLSSYEMTGTLLLVLREKSPALPPELKKIPMLFFSASSRQGLEDKLHENIKIFMNRHKN
jgi:hypothetical protein